MKASETEFVIFDVETTGLSPLQGDRMIEIAALRVKNGEVTGSFTSLINPGIPIPEQAQRINNITPAMIAEAPKTVQVLPDVLTFIGGSCLVGHNVKFDLDFLCNELSFMGRKLNDQTPVIDTLKMSKFLVPYLSSYRLMDLSVKFGVKVQETHRALADVYLTMAVLKRLLRTAEEQGIIKLQDVLKHFSVNKPHFKMEESSQEVLF